MKNIKELNGSLIGKKVVVIRHLNSDFNKGDVLTITGTRDSGKSIYLKFKERYSDSGYYFSKDNSNPNPIFEYLLEDDITIIIESLTTMEEKHVNI